MRYYETLTTTSQNYGFTKEIKISTKTVTVWIKRHLPRIQAVPMKSSNIIKFPRLNYKTRGLVLYSSVCLRSNYPSGLLKIKSLSVPSLFYYVNKWCQLSVQFSFITYATFKTLLRVELLEAKHKKLLLSSKTNWHVNSLLLRYL